MEFAEKVMIVTGGGSGIGQAAVRALAAGGAKVAIFDVRQDRATAMVDEITAQGGSAMGLAVNVAEPEPMLAAIEQVAAHWGRIDGIVANAGINGVWAPLEEITTEEWDRTINVNLRGTFLTVKYALPYLKRQGGAIVVIASVNGSRMFSNTGATAYSCAKAGQIAFAKMMAVELGPHRVRINAVCPGGVVTNLGENTERRNLEAVRIPVHYPQGMIPLTGSERATPEQVADLIYFLLSPRSSHITGSEIWIDGGQSLLQG